MHSDAPPSPPSGLRRPFTTTAGQEGLSTPVPVASVAEIAPIPDPATLALEAELQDLREREHAWMDMVMHAPLLLARVDLNHRYVFANAPYCERFHLQPADVIGRHVSDVVGKEAYQKMLPVALRVLAGETVSLEENLSYPVIGVRTVAMVARPARNLKGEISGWIAAIRDVTDQRRSEALVRWQSQMLEHSHDAIFVWSSNRGILHWGRGAEKLYGIASSDAVGQTSHRLLQTTARLPLAEIEQRLRANGSWTGELGHRRPDGSHLTVESSMLASRDTDGNVIVLETNRDITDRKQIEAQLQRFASLVQNTREFVGICDLEGRVLFVNRAGRAMVGLRTDEEAAATNVLDYFFPEDRTMIQEEFFPKVSRDGAGEVEVRIRHFQTHQPIWFTYHVIALRDSEGRLTGFATASRDITERRQAENVLRESEQRFRHMADHSPMTVWLTDEFGSCTYINRAWRNLTGQSETAAPGIGWQSAVHPEDRPTVAADWERAVKNRREFRTEFRVVRASGEVAWVIDFGAPRFGQDGEFMGHIGSVVDISDRKLMEDALRTKERHLRLVTETAPVMLAQCDRETRYVWANQQYLQRHGKTASEVIGHTAEQVMSAGHYATVKPYIERVLRGERVTFEQSLEHARLGPRWIRGAYSPTFDDRNGVTGFIAAIFDITEQRQSQEALREAQEKLQRHAEELERTVLERTSSLRRALEQMEEFSYAVSHDLRAPIRSIKGYAEVLLSDWAETLPADARSHVQRILRSSTRMEGLVNDVLTISRVAREKIQLSPVPLSRLAGDLAEEYRQNHAAARIQVLAPLPRVIGHEPLLQQALSNLLGNALKFVEPGRSPEVVISAVLKGKTVRVVVADNGIGIAPEHQKRIWDMFERVHPDQRFEGTGIGLAIVRKAIERLGGEVGVESDGTSGSRFWFELPLAPDSHEPRGD